MSLKFEHTEVVGWKHAIRGMRNPLESWERSDSETKLESWHDTSGGYFEVGPNDFDLMTRLRNAGTDHRKFMRMLVVYVDITAPLYWWKEFKTYRAGRKFGDDEPDIFPIPDEYLEFDIEMNSCSTMHKIAEKEFTLEDFSHEHLINSPLVESVPGRPELLNMQAINMLEVTIGVLNAARFNYLQTKDKKYWWQMIQLLPSSYNQRRTVMLNYEVLANMYKSRRNHKLDEWHTFCDWIEGLPYSELITGITDEKHKKVIEDVDKIIKTEYPKLVGIPYSEIEHLVDVTCSWHAEELNGDRLYAIGPGFTREDLTPYELYLLEKSEAYRKKGTE